MKKEILIKGVCDRYNITAQNVYPATGLYLKDGLRAVFGYVVNNKYFVDENSADIYDVADISQLDNVEEYED